MHQKLVPDSFLILVNNLKQPLHAKNSIENKDILLEEYQKALKKSTLFLLFNPVSLYRQNYLK